MAASQMQKQQQQRDQKQQKKPQYQYQQQQQQQQQPQQPHQRQHVPKQDVQKQQQRQSAQQSQNSSGKNRDRTGPKTKPGFVTPSSEDVVESVRSLYADRLEPFGRILLRRVREYCAIKQLRRSGAAPPFGDLSLYDVEDAPYVEPKLLQRLCKESRDLEVTAIDGNEITVLLVGQPMDFVDVASPEDPYPIQLWRAAATYFANLTDDVAFLPGGRYACARALAGRQLPFLAGRSLGEICHIVQLAVSQRKVLGYVDGNIVPYCLCEESIKEQCAAWQQPFSSASKGQPSQQQQPAQQPHGRGQQKQQQQQQRQQFAEPAAPVATWHDVRHCLAELMRAEQGSIAVSNIKRLFLSRFSLDLSETALGYARVSELLQDPRLQDICALRMQGPNQFMILCSAPAKRQQKQQAQAPQQQQQQPPFYHQGQYFEQDLARAHAQEPVADTAWAASAAAAAPPAWRQQEASAREPVVQLHSPMRVPGHGGGLSGFAGYSSAAATSERFEQPCLSTSPVTLRCPVFCEETAAASLAGLPMPPPLPADLCAAPAPTGAGDFGRRLPPGSFAPPPIAAPAAGIDRRQRRAPVPSMAPPPPPPPGLEGVMPQPVRMPTAAVTADTAASLMPELLNEQTGRWFGLGASLTAELQRLLQLDDQEQKATLAALSSPASSINTSSSDVNVSAPFLLPGAVLAEAAGGFDTMSRKGRFHRLSSLDSTSAGSDDPTSAGCMDSDASGRASGLSTLTPASFVDAAPGPSPFHTALDQAESQEFPTMLTAHFRAMACAKGGRSSSSEEDSEGSKQ